MIQVKVWEKARDTVDIAGDAGDILAPLKRIRKKYADRALKHRNAGRVLKIVYYLEQANNVDRLINQ
jgi:hypothetical protein